MNRYTEHLLFLEQFMPVMSPEELHLYEQIL